MRRKTDFEFKKRIEHRGTERHVRRSASRPGSQRPSFSRGLRKGGRPAHVLAAASRDGSRSVESRNRNPKLEIRNHIKSLNREKFQTGRPDAVLNLWSLDFEFV